MDPNEFEISNVEEVDSPALLIYPDRVIANIRRMLAIAGSPQKLCPHVKTHKMAEVIQLQMAVGITRFKCATIAEAEMVAACGARDVLLAHQPVGPKLLRLLQLMRTFPETKFSAIADDADMVGEASRAARAAGMQLTLLLDIDCGMKRTGIPPGPEAFELYRLLAGQAGLNAGGLHVYDGHIDSSDVKERERQCDAAFAPAAALRDQLVKAGLPVPRMVAGGTPTCPIHARRDDVECSPGTCVLWDAGYGTSCGETGFAYSALVLARVVSKPAGNRLCLDLGHKAIAAEKPHPRVIFLNLPDAKAVMHSEEHLVVETPQADSVQLGAAVYGVPRHVCPTVALHAEAVVVREGRATERWPVTARQRRLSC